MANEQFFSGMKNQDVFLTERICHGSALFSLGYGLEAAQAIAQKIGDGEEHSIISSSEDVENCG